MEESGEIVIAASRFNDLVRNFNGETVKVTKSENDNNVRLQSGKADYKILLMNVNEYPKYPSIEATQSFVLEEEKIKELIKKTAFACSSDSARPLFTGVLCDIKDNKYAPSGHPYAGCGKCTGHERYHSFPGIKGNQ